MKAMGAIRPPTVLGLGLTGSSHQQYGGRQGGKRGQAVSGGPGPLLRTSPSIILPLSVPTSSINIRAGIVKQSGESFLPTF